jgi:hypothetical protein
LSASRANPRKCLLIAGLAPGVSSWARGARRLKRLSRAGAAERGRVGRGGSRQAREQGLAAACAASRALPFPPALARLHLAVKTSAFGPLAAGRQTPATGSIVTARLGDLNSHFRPIPDMLTHSLVRVRDATRAWRSAMSRLISARFRSSGQNGAGCRLGWPHLAESRQRPLRPPKGKEDDG